MTQSYLFKLFIVVTLFFLILFSNNIVCLGGGRCFFFFLIGGRICEFGRFQARLIRFGFVKLLSSGHGSEELFFDRFGFVKSRSC